VIEYVLCLPIFRHFCIRAVRGGEKFSPCVEPFNFRRYAIAVLLLNLAARFVVRERKI
jgi:hypothetical protein